MSIYCKSIKNFRGLCTQIVKEIRSCSSSVLLRRLLLRLTIDVQGRDVSRRLRTRQERILEPTLFSREIPFSF